MNTDERKTSHNITYPKGGVSCLADTFVQAESSVFRTNCSAKNPALRVAAKTLAVSLTIDTKKYKDNIKMKIFAETERLLLREIF